MLGDAGVGGISPGSIARAAAKIPAHLISLRQGPGRRLFRDWDDHECPMKGNALALLGASRLDLTSRLFPARAPQPSSQFSSKSEPYEVGRGISLLLTSSSVSSGTHLVGPISHLSQTVRTRPVTSYDDRFCSPGRDDFSAFASPIRTGPTRS